MNKYKLGLLYEHPEWHTPLFDELTSRDISFCKIDLKKGAYALDDLPDADVYYNLVSPSAYKRGNQKAIPFAYSLCVHLESKGKLVLNGSNSMKLEMSKSAQMLLLQQIGISYPTSIVFNDVNSLRVHEHKIKFPQIIKPEQGGSGSRMFKVFSIDEVEEIFNDDPSLWLPDNLFLIQDEIKYDPEFGIIRLEFVGGELLYAMRVLTNGTFNLCPSVVCNPENGAEGACEIPAESTPEFKVYKEVPTEAVEEAKKIIKASGHNIASVEYVTNLQGQRFFYDINSNSNLRANISEEFGSGNPFVQVAKYLEGMTEPVALAST